MAVLCQRQSTSPTLGTSLMEHQWRCAAMPTSVTQCQTHTPTVHLCQRPGNRTSIAVALLPMAQQWEKWVTMLSIEAEVLFVQLCSRRFQDMYTLRNVCAPILD